jgi:ubiquinone/menaquinone biosynthesis C-methylase UbiE
MEGPMTAAEQWQLSSSAAERYERIVARYILGPWAPLLVERAAVAPGERVLDVACGTGVVGRIATQRVGAKGYVAGLDLNAGMIAVARSIPMAPGSTIDWHEGSALALPFPGGSFDVVLCQQGLQFFPDRALGLREMRRVLQAGGRLALSVWNSNGLYNTAVGEALAVRISQEVANRFLASRKAPTGEELRQLAADAGFSAIEVRVERITVHLPAVDTFALDHLAATPVAADIAAADIRAREEIGRGVKERLGRYVHEHGASYPEETNVLTARVP